MPTARVKLDEGNRNMAAAAHMVDLRPLSDRAPSQRNGTRAAQAQHRDMIDKARGAYLPARGVRGRASLHSSTHVFMNARCLGATYIRVKIDEKKVYHTQVSSSTSFNESIRSNKSCVFLFKSM